jgi:hypothetical protein
VEKPRHTIVRHDALAFAVSLGGSLVSFAAAFLVLATRLRGFGAAASGAGASVLFVVVYGVARRRLRRPGAGTEAFKEAVFLGFLAVAVAVATAHLAIP